MATEIEMKLGVPGTDVLEKVLADPELMQYAKDPYITRRMRSTYYDTPDNLLHQRKWTLRYRDEGGRPMVAFKTANRSNDAGFFTRGEWQCSVENIEDAIPILIDQGAPRELKSLLKGKGLRPCCGADFQRRSVCLYMDEGVRIEMAGDHGTLFGGGREAPICELELELLYGDAGCLVPLCQQLMDEYGLTVELRSKYQRARALAMEEEN